MILRKQRSKIVNELLAKQWADNYVANKKFIAELHDPVLAVGFAKSGDYKPALCVGAGPSLAKNIDKVNHDLYTIVACDKAAPKLLKHGIAADYIVALNASPTEVVHWLDEVNDSATTLVIPIGVHPDTYSKWKGHIKFINAVTSSKLHERAYSELGYIPFTIGSNAGTFAYNIAAMTGHNPIGCIGMDFSFLQECEVLAKQDYPTKFNVIKMTDVNDEIRYLDIGWFDMAQAFQEAAYRYAQWNGIRTFNCTEGGINYSEFVGEITLEAYNLWLQTEVAVREGK